MQDEHILIQDAIDGNQSALESLLSQHMQNIYNACYRVCLDSDDAHDIAQNVVLKIMKNLPKFYHKSKFSTWYYRIAYNESITFLKKNTGHDDISDIQHILGYDDGIGNTIDQQIQKQEITHQINRLPLIERNIILYFYYDDLKIKEIAEILDLNENTVKTKLSRTKKLLSTKLKNYETTH